MYAAGYATARITSSACHMVVAAVTTLKFAITHATVIAFTTLGIVVIFAVMFE
jgi:hypothetical protein